MLVFEKIKIGFNLEHNEKLNLEKEYVVLDKLGGIHVADGLAQNHVFRETVVGIAINGSRAAQDGLNGAQTVRVLSLKNKIKKLNIYINQNIIYKLSASNLGRQANLLGELLGHKFINGHNLLGQRGSIFEALAQQHDFRDGARVGNHHGHRAKQALQVVRKLSAAGITRVHGDKHAH